MVHERAGLVSFPAEPFRSIVEIEAYVAGDRIVCLVCGRAMKSLNSHIQRAHELSAEEYRQRFNIPKKFRLCSDGTAMAHSAVARRPENLERFRELGREYGPITRGHGIAHEMFRTGPREWDFSWHLNEAATNPLYLKARPPRGMASWHTFFDARFNDPELQRSWERARSKFDHQSHYQPRGYRGTFCPVGELTLGEPKSA